MKHTKWDQYFHSHYQPVNASWSQKDLTKYIQWYMSWISYIEAKIPLLRKKARIFEIGSAVGAVAKILHDRGHDVTGSDISPEMVRVARALCKPIPFVVCDIQKGIVSRKPFEAVIGFEVLEHVPKIERAVGKIYQALTKGGYFIGTSPYPYPKNFQDPTHVNVKYPDEWKELFLKAGFSSVDLQPLSFLPFVWRMSPRLNIVLPFRTGLPLLVSTTLIIARR
jgi:SAM-dependent methyltransferase